MGIASVSHGLGRTVWDCGRHKMPRHRQWHDRGRTAAAICQPEYRRHDRTRSGGRLCVKLPRKVCLCPAIFAARRAGQSKRGHQSGLFELCPILLLGAEPAFSAGSTAAYRNAADLVSISPSEVQPGDLRVVYASGGEQGHVQMALGSGVWIECCYGYGVAVNMSNAWMESRPCYYFRYAGF